MRETASRGAVRSNGGIAQMSDTKKASDLFIECLEAEGVEYIFGVPGEENLDFLESLSKSKKIKLILTRQKFVLGRGDMY